jgi:hypothetical protein
MTEGKSKPTLVATNEALEFDPFDPASLRQLAAGTVIATEKVITQIACKKPGKDVFFRIHDDPDMHLPTRVYVSGDRETYLVKPGLDVIAKTVPITLYLCMARHNEPFFWPVRVPDLDGKDNRYWESARQAAAKARDFWVRIETNQKAGRYDVVVASGDIPPPVWPDLTHGELLRLCFQDRYIQSPDHPVVLQLLGK